MRLFSQLSWYFLREWRRYLGAISLLIIIALLQLPPPHLVGVIVDGIMLVTAMIVYLLSYVWRVLLFVTFYQLAVELREDFYRQHPAFYLCHRTGDLIARATNDVDRVVFGAGEGVLTLVDSVSGCWP